MRQLTLILLNNSFVGGYAYLSFFFLQEYGPLQIAIFRCLKDWMLQSAHVSASQLLNFSPKFL